MTEKNIYPADNVDKDGVAYPTVGENIRNGNNGESLSDTTAENVNNWLFDTLPEQERFTLPLFPFSKGKWVEVIDTIVDGGVHSFNKLQDVTHDSTNSVAFLTPNVKFVVQNYTSYTTDRRVFAIAAQVTQKSKTRETNSHSVIFLAPVTSDMVGEECSFYAYVED